VSLSGYSLRKHIGNALKSRSTAIRTAVAKYNTAAGNLSPVRQELTWDEVVEYAFLADFDLLRDARQDIRSQPWATPAARQAMDGYFKLLRAEEEITRLNIEIRRFLTFMRDEDTFLSAKQKEVSLTDPALAYQIHMQCNDVNRFTLRHMKILNKTFQLPGFSGDMSFGVHITEPFFPAPTPPPTMEPSLPARSPPAPIPPPNISASDAANAMSTTVEDDPVDLEADLEEEQAGEDEEQAVLEAYSIILEFTYD
jgi:hypothetical protein